MINYGIVIDEYSPRRKYIMKKRLNFLASNLSGKGGTETVLITVLNNLIKNRDVSLTLIDEPQDKNWLQKLDDKVSVNIHTGNNLVSKIWFIMKIFIFEKDTNYISLSPSLILIANKVRKLCRKKYKIISWIHFSLKNQDMFDPGKLVNADGHLAISSVIREQLLELGVKSDEIITIFNPIERHNSIPEVKKENYLNLFYAGRMTFDGQKNISELLSGISKIKGINYHLDMYGSGEDLEKCKEYGKKLGINGNIIWHGWTKNLWEEINVRPSALVMSSKYEGLPMIMLESISRGIPVVTTKFDGYEDIVKEGVNGYTYKSGNIEELGQKLIKISEQKISTKDIQDSIENYYTENYFKNLENALVKLEKI